MRLDVKGSFKLPLLLVLWYYRCNANLRYYLVIVHLHITLEVVYVVSDRECPISRFCNLFMG